MVWYRDLLSKNDNKEYQYLEISKQLFDTDGKLKPMIPGEWDDKFIKISRAKKEMNDEAPVQNRLAELMNNTSL